MHCNKYGLLSSLLQDSKESKIKLKDITIKIINALRSGGPAAHNEGGRGGEHTAGAEAKQVREAQGGLGTAGSQPHLLPLSPEWDLAQGCHQLCKETMPESSTQSRGHILGAPAPPAALSSQERVIHTHTAAVPTVAPLHIPRRSGAFSAPCPTKGSEAKASHVLWGQLEDGGRTGELDRIFVDSKTLSCQNAPSPTMQDLLPRRRKSLVSQFGPRRVSQPTTKPVVQHAPQHRNTQQHCSSEGCSPTENHSTAA